MRASRKSKHNPKFESSGSHSKLKEVNEMAKRKHRRKK